tara:strand:+ start:311 stop:421 length:111 start_codon:yes stop_codon:yes gene_type:complete
MFPPNLSVKYILTTLQDITIMKTENPGVAYGRQKGD